MKALTALPLLGAALAAATIDISPRGAGIPVHSSSGAVVRATRQTLAVWSTYSGRIEPRSPITIVSGFRGGSVVTELAPDGARVKAGDVLVRLDSAEVERDVVKLEKDVALAQSELTSYVNAKVPLQLEDLSIKLNNAKNVLKQEEAYLNTIAGLTDEDLISAQEISQQRDKVANCRTEVQKLELEVRLTREYVQPAEIKRARAAVAAAEHELDAAREQLRNATITAPVAGIVIHNPVNVASEFRTVRVGDTIYPNQPVMMLDDMKELVAQFDLPESEFLRVKAGDSAFAQPLSLPRERFRAVVEQVSPLARSLPGRPAWQEYFRVVAKLLDRDPRFRPGMSVTLQVLSDERVNALTVPRAAIHWRDGTAYVRLARSTETKRVVLGVADDMRVEVRDGLSDGEEVVE